MSLRLAFTGECRGFNAETVADWLGLRPLKRYAEFSGRSSRAEFWWFFLFTMVIYFVAAFALGGVGAGLASLNPTGSVASGSFGAVMLFIIFFWIVLFIPMLAVQIRRLHDTNRSGWWLGIFWLLYIAYIGLAFGMISLAAGNAGAPPNLALLGAVGIFAIVFFIYSIVLMVFFCLRGTEGPNRYGDDPYGENIEEVFA